MGPQITETTIISYFIANNKTCSSHKLDSILPKYTVDKIINIHIPVNEIQDKLFSDLHIMKTFQLKQSLGQIMMTFHPILRQNCLTIFGIKSDP